MRKKYEMLKKKQQKQKEKNIFLNIWKKKRKK